MALEFIKHEPTTEDCWRAIVLYGLNVASYKFALVKSLLDLSAERKSFVTLKDLGGSIIGTPDRTI